MPMLQKIKLNLRSKDEERINKSNYVSLPNEENDLKITLKRKLERPDNNRQSKKMKRNKSYTSLNDDNVELFSENKEESNKEKNWQAKTPSSSSISQKSMANTISEAAKNLENSLAHSAADNSDIDSTLSTVESSKEISLFTNKPIIEENIRNKNQKIDIFVNEADQRHVIQSPQKQQENQESSNAEHADSTNNVEKQDNEEMSSSFSEMTCVEENVRTEQEEIVEIIFLKENSQSRKSSSKSPNISTTESYDVQDNNINSCDKSQILETLLCNNTLTKDVTKTVIGNHLLTTTFLSKSSLPEECSSQDKCIDNEISSVAIADLPSDNCVNELPVTDGNIELELQIRPKTHPEAIQTFSMKASLDSLNICLENLNKYKNNPEALFELLKHNSNTSAEQPEKQQDTQITSENGSESIRSPCKTSDPKQQSAENRSDGNENTTDEQTPNTKSFGSIKVRSWEELRSPISSTSQMEPNIFNLISNSQVPSQVSEQSSSCTECDSMTSHSSDSLRKQFAEIRSAIQNIMTSLHHFRSVVTFAIMQDSILSKQQVQEMKDNMAKLNTNICKLRKMLHVRSYESAMEFLNVFTGLPSLTVEEYNKLAVVIDTYSQFYKLSRGTYLNISHLTNNISHNSNFICNNTQMSSQSALSPSHVSSSSTKISNRGKSQSSTLSNAFPTNSSNISYQQFSRSINYLKQHASSSYQQQLANNIPSPSHPNGITSPLGAQSANHVSSPPYLDGVTLTPNVQRANNVPSSSYPNRVISMSIAQQAPMNSNNVMYISNAFESNINVSGSACQTNASLNRGIPQTITSQIVQPDIPVMILPTMQTVPQQNVQHGFANPSVPQHQPANSSVYQQNLANSSVQHQILANPSLQRSVVVNPSMQYQTLANLSVQQTQESHLTNVYAQQQQVANLSGYQQNLANSSMRHQTFANLPTQEDNATSSFARLQQLAKMPMYKQNTANPPVKRQVLANQSMLRQNLRQNLCKNADCTDCSQIVSNNLQNIRKNQNSAHGCVPTSRSDTINNSLTNASNSMFNSRVEFSKLQNNNCAPNKTSNQRNMHQEFTDTQNLSQKLPIAQTSTSQNSKLLQNTTCDTLSEKDQTRIAVNELITSNRFYLDLGFLTDTQKFALCKQLGYNYEILMWIRKNASKNISEKLDETMQWTLFLHKYMRQRTNEILKDFYLDNQSQNSSTPMSSETTDKISKKNVEISTAKQLSEHSNVPKDDSIITNTSCNESGAEKTKALDMPTIDEALDMPEIDEDSNENSEIVNSNVNNKDNLCKTSKNVVINIENKDNAHSSRNNEDQSEKVDNALNDVQVTRNNNEENINRSKSRSQSIISYAPRSSTPIASSNNLKPSLNDCKCTRISQTCAHCKHIIEIMGLHFDTEQGKNEKPLSVTNSYDISDEGCDFDPERLVIDEQGGTVTRNEEDNYVSDATLSQPRILENDAEADSCQTIAYEAQDTSNTNQSSIRSADTDAISTEFAMRKAENVDTHSGVKTINKIFERVAVYKRHASPRISARRVQLEPTNVNVRGYASNEDDSLGSECTSNTDHNATLQFLSDTGNDRNKENSKDNCEVSDEKKSNDETRNTGEEDNNKLTTKNDTHTPDYFTDYEMISDFEEDTIYFSKTEDDVTLQSSDTNMKENLSTEDVLNNEKFPKIEENTLQLPTLQLPVAVENQNKEEYKDNCEVSGEESDDKASNNINKKEEYKSTKLDLHTNYTDNEEISDITEHGVLSPKTEDDIALQVLEDAIVKENISVEDKSENVTGAENARNKYVANNEENVTLQLPSTVEKQPENEYGDNYEASGEESDDDISKKDSDKLVMINENRASCSNEVNADNTEDNVILLEEYQFDENNILSPEATFQVEDAFNNKLVLDTELSATLQFQIGMENFGEEEHNNNDHDVSSKTSDETTCNDTEDISTSNSTEVSNNFEENIKISELDTTNLSRQNDEIEILPTILKVQTISESMFNEMDISNASEIAQNNAKKVDKNEISQVNTEINVEVNAEGEIETNCKGNNNNTKSDKERMPCLRCKRPSTVYCEACLSAAYCSKRCAGLHWKSQHRNTCTRKHKSL